MTLEVSLDLEKERVLERGTNEEGGTRKGGERITPLRVGTSLKFIS